MACVQLVTILNIFFFFLLINEGSAIRCFQCNSHIDKECDKASPENKVVDCSSLRDGGKNYTFCRKIVQIIEFPVNDLPADSRIIRGCGWDTSNYQNACYQRAGFGGRQEVCACSKDECNAADLKTVSNVALGASLMMLFAYMLRA